MTRCSALSRTAQVFTRITSAPSRSLGLAQTLAAEHPEHQLGVRDVHLAAVGLDVDALHWGKDGAMGRKGGRGRHGWTVTPTDSSSACSLYPPLCFRQARSRLKSTPARSFAKWNPVPPVRLNSSGRPSVFRGNGNFA